MGAVNICPAPVGAVGTVVSAITGMLSAAKDPTQGGACPPTVNGVQVTSAGQLNQLINQTFYNLTGMSPMQWTASNGAYSTSGTSGTDTSSITTVVGGYTTSGRQ